METLAQLTTSEFEDVVVRTIDQRLGIWFTQLIDAWTDLLDKEDSEIRSEFAVSLKIALEQARAGEGTDLKTFREQLGF